MSRGLAIAAAILLTAVLALGICVVYLKHEAQQQEQSQNAPVVPTPTEAPTPVRLVLANDADGSLKTASIEVTLPPGTAERSRQILRALVAKGQQPGSPHPMPPGADVNVVYTTGGNLAVVDVNSAFADGHRSGIMVEELTLASLAETLSANVPGVTRMKLLVDGKERSTLAGHADLSEPYDVSFDTSLMQSAR